MKKLIGPCVGALWVLLIVWGLVTAAGATAFPGGQEGEGAVRENPPAVAGMIAMGDEEGEEEEGMEAEGEEGEEEAEEAKEGEHREGAREAEDEDDDEEEAEEAGGQGCRGCCRAEGEAAALGCLPPEVRAAICNLAGDAEVRRVETTYRVELEKDGKPFNVTITVECPAAQEEAAEHHEEAEQHEEAEEHEEGEDQ
jgi:hypothetical protein